MTKEDAYPIKTYIDYKLDKLETEEEMKNDPLASLIELMGTMKEGENMWYQALIRANTTKWGEAGVKIVDKIMKRDVATVQAKAKAKAEKIDFGSMILSPGERMIVEAIERNVSKLGFDACLRFVYIAKPDKYNHVVSNAIQGSMKQFNSLNLNGFERDQQHQLCGLFFQKNKRRLEEKKNV